MNKHKKHCLPAVMAVLLSVLLFSACDTTDGQTANTSPESESETIAEPIVSDNDSSLVSTDTSDSSNAPDDTTLPDSTTADKATTLPENVILPADFF